MKRSLIILSTLLVAACQQMPQTLPTPVTMVLPTLETTPMRGRGDKADDPAIWVHPTSPERSLILGTNKDAGLYVYGLDGEERQQLLVGRINNVDLRGNLAVASNDEANGLSWFSIEPSSQTVSHEGNTPLDRIEPYGVCSGQIDSELLVAVTYKDGTVELWETALSDAPPEIMLRRTVQLDSQLEGCVFDDDNQRLFIGEEAFGVWVLDLSAEDSQPEVVDAISNGNGLVADVEGLSLYLEPDGSGYLVVSAQEADRFVIYERLPPYRLAGIITIGKTDTIDAVTHTDGLDISSAAFPAFPQGLLVVQDDGNPRSGVDQNFKLVDWRRVQDAISRVE